MKTKAEPPMSNSASISSDRGQTRSRDKGAGGKIVVVELNDVHSDLEVRALVSGEGKLIDRIEDIVDDLVAAGTLKADAQTAVFVVHEFVHAPLGSLGDEDEDQDEDHADD
jgi:hypothetical protein